jgi:hypothetical protein
VRYNLLYEEMIRGQAVERIERVNRGEDRIAPNDYKDLLMLIGLSEDEADKRAAKYLVSITPK